MAAGDARRGIAALHWPLAIVAAAMFVMSLLVAGLQARQASLAPQYEGLPSRLLLMWLCYAQPLVRSWSRYRTRFFAYRPPLAEPISGNARNRLSLAGKRTVQYWTEDGSERIELLGMVVAYLNEHRWGKTIDTGWRDWDLEIYCHPWTVVQVCTVEEEHGSEKRMIQARFRLRTNGYTRLLIGGLPVFRRSLPRSFRSGRPRRRALLGVARGAWVRGVYARDRRCTCSTSSPGSWASSAATRRLQRERGDRQFANGTGVNGQASRRKMEQPDGNPAIPLRKGF
jgi:hypothetical protein